MNLSTLLRSVSNGLGFGTATRKSDLGRHLGTPSSTSSSSSNNSNLDPVSSLLIPSEDEDEAISLGENHLASADASLSKNQSSNPYQQTVQQILRLVNELEHTIYEDRQQEFKLRMALDRQTERVQELVFSLDTERKRNERLVQLLRGIDSSSSGESDPEKTGPSGSHVNSIGELYDSISPLLMQQRYVELSVSHRQSRRQLAKREKALKVLQSKTEQLHSKYDELFDEYRSEQRRFEMLCTRYIQMQLKKKQQIFNLKNTLGQASECIFHAQVVIDECCHAEKPPISPENLENFRRNLECFMDALRNCCCLRKVHELQQQQLKKEEMEKCQSQNPVDDLLTPRARERSSQEQSSDTYVQNLSNRHPRFRRYRHSAR
ncbi:uncharacterized protein LOC6738143 [Drosophila simulans]|uniref:GD14542 n=1 Tax=Drosophila simulans TaxID=7240 RepID=B4QL16_DROSI|nr:uncharacterized protein LOC6738143 [Drosophila simulans]EDX10541.1 GD14542 [Drosophila simulans]KMY99739.1 uncharacterized protein Dsimw501_GD14542 [Drosophila simulans]